MSKPLIVHVVYRLDYGGLENGLVNLINRLPGDKYRHAIVCLAGYSDFRRRIRARDVEIFDLGKKPGKDPFAYFRLWLLLLRLRPKIVHTRNSGTIDCAIVAFFAAVPVRIHGCHGWDAADLQGRNPKGRRLRRICHPFISAYTAVSRDLRDWLVTTDAIDQRLICLVYNGVDCERFRPDGEGPAADLFAAGDRPLFVIGTIGRLDKVKDQLTLARTFVALIERRPEYREYVRLAFIGDGDMRASIETVLDEAGLGRQARVLGWRDDIDRVLRRFDVFCLPSLNEGISNTLLEAMAAGLPVVATSVGGNVELVENGATGFLVEPGNVGQMTDALEKYLQSGERLAERHGRNARRRAESEFSLERMVRQYDSFYTGFLSPARASGH